jgi:hypothetical protein
VGIAVPTNGQELPTTIHTSHKMKDIGLSYDGMSQFISRIQQYA